MAPTLILACIAGYFVFLLAIAWITSRNADSDAYFLGNRASPWYVVAFGLIGDSLSGVTFISVPGQVSQSRFTYLQIVFGYVLGYVVIAQVLLPIYYRLNLISIYSYLRGRFGANSQKAGSFCFLLSRTTGAAARLYLAANVLQSFVFDRWNVPFVLTVAGIISLILVYTLRGGIKTLVWTDTFQSTFLLLGLVFSIIAIMRDLQWDLPATVAAIRTGPHAGVFDWDWRSPTYFWKQFFSGASIAIVMTGLDQNMMQKNLSCKSLKSAQLNLYSFTGVLVAVNILFLSLGALLYSYATIRGVPVPAQTDQLFPLLALRHLQGLAAISFVVGLTAATFSSADSVLTTLTTSYCIDFLGLDRREDLAKAAKAKVRGQVHLAFAGILLLVIMAFKAVNSSALINAVFTLASYTYGPLLGLFAVGLFSGMQVRDRWVPGVVMVSPLAAWVIADNAPKWLGGYRFGFELLILNGLLTVGGLWLIRRRGAD